MSDYIEFVCTECGGNRIWDRSLLRCLSRCGCGEYNRRNAHNEIPDGVMVLWDELR